MTTSLYSATPGRPPSASRPAGTPDGGEPARGTPIRLLVVDDDLGAIECLGHSLKGFAQISFATNGEDALRLARQHRPDLVLLDIDLGDGDGFHVCQALRADPAHDRMPIMFLTQSGSEGHEALALAVGGDDFMRKPFNAPVLRARLRRLVDHQRRPASASMLSYIAHELGNPVHVIRGFAQLMQINHAEPLQPGQAEKLGHILDAVDRLDSLLADVSDVAHMAAGQFSIESAAVELHALVQQAGGPALAQAAAAGVALTLPRPDGPVTVKADARRLRQCLDNLLSNALKYGSAGARIEVEIAVRGGEVALAVQDHGAGLSAVQLAQLCEPYNRLGHDGGPIPGTGLGLALTHELVQAMGGRLRVHSDGPGRGCRFELLLKPAVD